MTSITKATITLLTFVVSVTVHAYDYTVKDKYGNTTGYLDTDDNGKTHVIDKYGNRSDYIESDGTVKDKYGNKKGTIEKDD